MYITNVKKSIVSWLNSVACEDNAWGKWKYNIHMQRPYGAISSAYAIWILSMLDELKNISPASRNEAITFFQSCQNPKTGFFMDPLVTEKDFQGKNNHSWEDVTVQMFDIKLGLDYLGEKPKYNLPKKRFTNLEQIDIKEWVLSLKWSNPWLAGWQWDQCIRAFNNSHTTISDDEKNDRINLAFETFENYVMDPKTGLPVKLGCNDLIVGSAGLFKVLFTYNELKRTLPYSRKAIDTVLSLQNSNGEFGSGGDMCINWDLVYVLREIDKRLDGVYKHKEIAQSMDLLAKSLLKDYKKPDGGFAFHRDHCLQYHMSIYLSKPYPEGDMVGTLQSLFCLQYADEYTS